MATPVNEIENQKEEYVFAREIMSSHLGVINLRCSWDFKTAMPHS